MKKIKTAGEQLLENFETKLSEENKAVNSRLLQVASTKLFSESERPASTFISYGCGVQSNGRNDVIIPTVTKPNVILQDQAINEGKIADINFSTIKESADVITDRAVAYEYVQRVFPKMIGRRDWDLYMYQGIYDFRLKEALLVDILGGAPVIPEAEEVGWHAIAKTACRNSRSFGDLFRKNKIDVDKDVRGTYQFIKHYGFDTFAKRACSDIAYFNRRLPYINAVNKRTDFVKQTQDGQNLKVFDDELILDWIINKLSGGKVSGKDAREAFLGVIAEKKSDTVRNTEKTITSTVKRESDTQKLNNKIKKFAFNNNIVVPDAWYEFVGRFNRYENCNLIAMKNMYAKKLGRKTMTTPKYLESVGKLKIALIIADEMLSQPYAI